MKNILLVLLLITTLNAVASPKLFKIQYVGTKIVCYSDVETTYNGRKDIIIYKLVNGKYKVV